ncbi:hypothetical protein 2 [Wuhan insect virus 26]|uniref:RNA-directed RNA polymerase n=1 Tax=Wuhan insect virus 26 TaxID=1923730 RepID=A0A1L3KF50_9VIRU|nr:hypothetical protein 2 [Wuhan insect virus 26]APG76048.1 hypothetical protein 2 [Wuhan insect virus 26]
MQERDSFTALDICDGMREGREHTFAVRSGHVPTGLRITCNGTYLGVPFKQAELLLIDRLPAKLHECNVAYDYYGTVVSARLVPGRDATYVYYYVDQDIQPVTQNLLGMLSRHFLGDFSGYYNDWCSLDNVFYSLSKCDNPVKRHTIKTIRDLPKPKISGAHHIHYTASEVWSVLDDRGKDAARHALRLPADATTSFVGGVMLWLASLPTELLNPIIESDLLDAEDTIEFGKKAKKLSVTAKSFQNIVEADLRPIFEADVLVNRDVGEVDWAGEKNNRCKPNLASVSPGEVYARTLALFTKEDDEKALPRRLEWEKFWDARWQWSASGSIHSQYQEDLDSLPKERELKNKFIALSMQGDMPFEHFLNRKPEIVAWSSVKYEWGKMRAIYGTDLTSYVLAHYAFFNCEDTLPTDFPVGEKARPSFVSARVAAILEGTVPLCVDFEDFNSQHSNDAMEAVVQAYIDAYSQYMTPEQVQAAMWTRESISNTRVIDNMGTKTSYKTKGTLMSGWRLTTFINSVLNYVYTQALISGSHAMSRSVHNGDDVLLGIRNFKIVRDIVARADKYNVRLQRTKCAFGGLAEFLRVDHMRGDYGQYLTRNIATVMHSRIESKIAVSAVDVVQAMEDRLREYLQRGGVWDYAVQLRELYYDRMAPIYSLRPQDLYDIRTAHRVVGGIAEDVSARVDKFIRTSSESIETTLPDTLPGVDAYARLLKKVLELEVPVSVVSTRIRNATLNAVQLTRKTVTVEKTLNVQRYMVYRALYRAYADVTNNPMFGKAMLTGFIFDVLTQNAQLSAVAQLVSSAQNPMEFLRVIS